jgi:N-formylglutamate amidohydrolase
VTETYGRPQNKRHSIQVELKRGLYMDEKSKAYLPGPSAEIQKKIEAAVSSILKGLT